MSIIKTKEQLVQLLSQADNRVIALSGKWGTGKTHLLDEVKLESADDQLKSLLYVSLFGLSSIDQLKRKLIEAAIPGVESNGGIFEGIKNLFDTGLKAAAEHYKALAAINDLNVLLMAPIMLRNKLIVIDDIERKHEKLGIDEVLGFIDEYSKQYGTRFLLVLNDDQLSTKGDQKILWTMFREKVIDQEIKLSTSAEEAFCIAIGLSQSKYAESIKQASISCALTNIRVIVKIIKAVNQVLAGRELDEIIQTRVVPSIVLFSAIHFRGLDNGPDFKFVLNVGNPDWGGFLKGKNEEPSTPEEKRIVGWRMLIQELGISSCDEFEKHLVVFLETGLLAADSINAVIDRYMTETEEMKARDAAHRFLNRVYWDHQVSEEQLVAEAKIFPAMAEFLNAFVATELQSVLAQLSGGVEIGEAIIDSWIVGFRKGDPSTVNDVNPFNNPLHEKIQAEFSAIKAKNEANTTVIDACLYIRNNSGWGTVQEIALRQATASEIVAAIRNIEDLDKFRQFMLQMIKMRVNHETYFPHFGTFTEQFVEACRDIANDEASPRLAKLIQRLFDDANLSSELVKQVCDKETPK